jgi:hypothetical protein
MLRSMNATMIERYKGMGIKWGTERRGEDAGGLVEVDTADTARP